MKDIVVRGISVADVIAGDRTKYNVNNLWNHDENGLLRQPEDYHQVIQRSATVNWIHRFHVNVPILVLKSRDIRWMNEALEIGSITGEISSLHHDELQDTIDKYDKCFPSPSGGWFVKCDSNSPKYGIHRAGPYHNIKMVLESLITTIAISLLSDHLL